MADVKKTELKTVPICSFCGNDAGDALLIKELTEAISVRVVLVNVPISWLSIVKA